jgi:hypothetical protein
MAQGGKFEIEVPIKIKGGNVSAGAQVGQQEDKKTVASIEKLRSSIVESIGVTKILGDIFGGLYDLIKPLIKILNALLIVIFLPLLPLLTTISKALGDFVAAVAKAGGGLTGIQAGFEGSSEGIIAKYGKIAAAVIAGILLAVGGVILFLIGGWILVLLGAIGALIVAFWSEIKDFFINAAAVVAKVFTSIGSGIMYVWNNILLPAWNFLASSIGYIWTGILQPAWNFLANVGQWIWEQILKPAFSFLSNVGQWIWDMISAPFRWLADKIGSIGGWFGFGGKKNVNDVILRPNGQIIETSPSDTIFATKNPGKFASGGNNISISINNPIVRDNNDIKEIANQISKIWKGKLNGRISPR